MDVHATLDASACRGNVVRPAKSVLQTSGVDPPPVWHIGNGDGTKRISGIVNRCIKWPKGQRKSKDVSNTFVSDCIHDVEARKSRPRILRVDGTMWSVLDKGGEESFNAFVSRWFTKEWPVIVYCRTESDIPHGIRLNSQIDGSPPIRSCSLRVHPKGTMSRG